MYIAHKDMKNKISHTLRYDCRIYVEITIGSIYMLDRMEAITNKFHRHQFDIINSTNSHQKKHLMHLKLRHVKCIVRFDCDHFTYSMAINAYSANDGNHLIITLDDISSANECQTNK